jgi:hypothetical protein
MKIIFAIIVSLSILTIFFGSNQAYAKCMLDKDWPNKPCIDTSPPLPLSKSEWRELWSEYYFFKGGEWMEQQKSVLDKQIQSGNLQEWIESGSDLQNFTNYNVWFYYYVNDKAPAPAGYALVDEINNEILSPLKQFKAGIPIYEIICKKGMDLVIRSENTSPVCLKHGSFEILKQRGWITNSN